MARNQVLVPQARAGLERMKFETASEVGVTLNPGYNGNIAARDAGKVGGNMVKKLISQAESTIR
jgi:hypothetical protein